MRTGHKIPLAGTYSLVSRPFPLQPEPCEALQEDYEIDFKLRPVSLLGPGDPSGVALRKGIGPSFALPPPQQEGSGSVFPCGFAGAPGVSCTLCSLASEHLDKGVSVTRHARCLRARLSRVRGVSGDQVFKTFLARKAAFMSNKRNRSRILLATVIAAATLASAYAVGSYLDSFKITYPATANTRLDSCSLCHNDINTSSARNAYGSAYAGAGHNFKSIESLDSDGDGFTNGDEIKNLTYPGNAADKPAGDTTAPTVTDFVIPATSSSLTVSITTLTATDAENDPLIEHVCKKLRIETFRVNPLTKRPY